MRVLLTLVGCCLIATVTGCWGDADEPKPDAMTPQEIFDRMAKVYAGCKSYRDTGVVKTVFVEALGNRTVKKPFKTAFVRPEHFRFEYTEDQGGRETRYIVWRKGKTVQTWWTLKPGVEKPDSLELALAGATGVSGGSAATVAALLLPNEVSWGSLTGLRAAKRLEDAKLDKADCFRVAGKFGKSPRTLWIEKKTFLLLRIDSKNKLTNCSTEETTTYAPVIDEEILDKALEFDPPKGK
jgi:outer membrane lipoprotein-sorting protein